MKDQIGVSSVTLVAQERNKAAKFPQYLGALLVTFGGFGTGTILGWTSPAEQRLERNEYGFVVTVDSFSWISSIMAIGAVLAAPVVGWLVDRCGRKTTILLLCIPSLVGWGLLIWAESVLMFCVGRFICGMAAGGWCVSVPLYTNELSEIDIRGILGTYFQLQISSGILFVYVVGTYVTVFWLSLICAILVVLFAVLMLFMPETPTYYLRTNEVEKAKLSLQVFRGKDYDVNLEIEDLQKNVEEVLRNQISLLEAFKSSPAKRGLVIGIGLMFYQQFSGINGIIFYTTTIFEQSGSSLDSSVQTMIVGAVMAIATYFCSLGIDRFGRRPLLVFSSSVMTFSTFILGGYFFFKDNGTDVSLFSWVPIAALCVFLVAFAVGYGPIPWPLINEIFSKHIAGYACSIVTLSNWALLFVVTRYFPSMKSLMGFAGTFWVFSALTATGILFGIFIVPETKGMSIEEMQVKLGGKPTSIEDGDIPTKF